MATGFRRRRRWERSEGEWEGEEACRLRNHSIKMHKSEGANASSTSAITRLKVPPRPNSTKRGLHTEHFTRNLPKLSEEQPNQCAFYLTKKLMSPMGKLFVLCC
mmetsp:Transcript_31898/g.95508  ORF Transcript_31898/g.95508 Transcript_31898/m.95508 type:complete len:104 (+) Transcript_31898:3231-3542(+)